MGGGGLLSVGVGRYERSACHIRAFSKFRLSHDMSGIFNVLGCNPSILLPV